MFQRGFFSWPQIWQCVRSPKLAAAPNCLHYVRREARRRVICLREDALAFTPQTILRAVARVQHAKTLMKSSSQSRELAWRPNGSGARPTKHISKFDENSERSSFDYTRPITTIFCTRHDSDTVVTCAKYRCDRPRIFYTRGVLNFHRISNSVEICLVGRAPGTHLLAAQGDLAWWCKSTASWFPFNPMNCVWHLALRRAWYKSPLMKIH